LGPGVDQYLRIYADDCRAMALLPKNDLVDAFNTMVVSRLGLETQEFTAVDGVARTVRAKKKRRGRPCKQATKAARKLKAADTAGLEETLTLGIGARVMLRRNLDQTVGLVNGALGTVTAFERCRTGRVEAIRVKFDRIDQPYSIERIDAAYELYKDTFVTRNQFPLVVGYAVSIHKSQAS